MSDQIQNMLIIAVAAVLIVGIILFVLRDKISQINFKAKGIDANVKTRVNKGITISKVKQKGDGNKMNIATDDIQVSEFEQEGNNQELNVRKS